MKQKTILMVAIVGLCLSFALLFAAVKSSIDSAKQPNSPHAVTDGKLIPVVDSPTHNVRIDDVQPAYGGIQ